jgi:hypothetical protein
MRFADKERRANLQCSYAPLRGWPFNGQADEAF